MATEVEFQRTGLSKYPKIACLKAPYFGFAFELYSNVTVSKPEQSPIASKACACITSSGNVIFAVGYTVHLI